MGKILKDYQYLLIAIVVLLFVYYYVLGDSYENMEEDKSNDTCPNINIPYDYGNNNCYLFDNDCSNNNCMYIPCNLKDINKNCKTCTNNPKCSALSMNNGITCESGSGETDCDKPYPGDPGGTYNFGCPSGYKFNNQDYNSDEPYYVCVPKQ